MATLRQTTNRVDAWFASNGGPLTTEQQSRGSRRFLQLVPSHRTPPAHTSSADGDSAPDNLTTKRGDKSWQDVDSAMVGRSAPTSIEVHEYEGPEGRGYIVILSMSFDGDEYRKHTDYGPEGRSSDWRKVDDTP